MPSRNVDYHLQSYADPRGRLFTENDNIYRLIPETSKEFYKKFITSSLFQSLTEDHLLVRSRIASDNEFDGSLIVEHNKIQALSFAFEWSFEGLKACALAMLDLQERLLNHGLSLHDGHPFNVLFDGCDPVFVDFTSITTTGSNGWSAAREFRHTVLNPLRLMATGNTKVPRSMLARGKGISDDEVELLLGRGAGIIGQARRAVNKIRYKRQTDPMRTVRELRSTVQKLSFPKRDTEWGNYYKQPTPLDLDHYDNLKQENVRKVLDRIRPSTILDAACNQGWFARLGHRYGAKVIGFDLDEVAVNKAFLDCKHAKADVLPLVMDFANPSPALGILNAGYPNAIQRFKSEMVLALAIVHHLVFRANLRFEQIVSTLEAMTEKWLLIEFIPKEDTHVAKWKKQAPDWYNLANLQALLSKSFDRVEIIPSEPSPRVLLLCTRG